MDFTLRKDQYMNVNVRTSNPQQVQHNGISKRKQHGIRRILNASPRNCHTRPKQPQQLGWLQLRQSWQDNRTFLHDVHRQHGFSTRTNLGLSHKSFPEALSDSRIKRECYQVPYPFNNDCGNHLRCRPHYDSQRQVRPKSTSDRIITLLIMCCDTQSLLAFRYTM